MANLAIFTIVKDDSATITLNVDQQAAAFVGYHLISYGPQTGALDIARNGSPYTDGSRIVNQRSENIVEQYTLDIVGSSPDDAMLKLAVLYQLVYKARDRSIYPIWRNPPVINYNIPGTTRAGSAYIINGTVSETSQTPRINIEGNRIKGIVLTLERTRWYASASSLPSPVTYKAFGSVAPWGIINIDNASYGKVNGDIEAPVSLRFGFLPTSATKIGRIVCGYWSEQRMRGGYTSPTIPSTPKLLEAESGFARTNFNLGASAVASPGGGGNTYAISTAATGQLYLSAGADFQGKWRCYMRCLSSGNSTVSMTTQSSGGFPSTTFAPVAVGSTSSQWRLFDMGVVDTPTVAGLGSNGAITETMILIFNSTTATGTIAIDCFIFIPCGEYFVDMRLVNDITVSGPLVYYNNILTPSAIGAYSAPITGSPGIYSTMRSSGDMRFPPGLGAFYWLAGDINFANTLGSAGGNINMGVDVAYQYETAPSS